MRRKRGNRGTWLPVNPTFIPDSDISRTYYDYREGFSNPVAVGDSNQRATALTLDDTPDVNTTGEYTLRDYAEGQDYILERVVGKIWCAMTQTEEQQIVRVLACAALAILPTQSGASQPDLPPEEWHPLYAQNAQQPWIWRRTWQIQNDDFVGALQYAYPITNAQYQASALDGPHIDTKGSRRRVSKEQRLYLITSCSVLAISETPEAPTGQLNWTYDVRVFGSMRRGRNKSAF